MTDPTDDVLPVAAEWLAEGRDLALATVVATWGSSPRPTGSQLLVDGAGNFLGSVSGGCVEGEVVRKAREIVRDGGHELLGFGVSDEDAWDVGLACGGRIEVLVTPCLTAPTLSAIAAARADGRAALLLTSLASGESTLLGEDPAGWPPGVAEHAADALRTDRGRRLEIAGREHFLQVFSLPLRMVVVGAVHIAQALIPMARAAGYSVALVDPRRAFASETRFPGVELRHEWPAPAFARLRPDARTAVVALTHDPKLDTPALAEALASPAFYVGVLGSRRTLAKRLASLREQGVDEANLARIHGPIGLDIGAATPAEIAIAIMAEVTATLRRRTAAIPTGARAETRTG